MLAKFNGTLAAKMKCVIIAGHGLFTSTPRLDQCWQRGRNRDLIQRQPRPGIGSTYALTGRFEPFVCFRTALAGLRTTPIVRWIKLPTVCLDFRTSQAIGRAANESIFHFSFSQWVCPPSLLRLENTCPPRVQGKSALSKRFGETLLGRNDNNYK
jgi:hypothetical protein